MADIDYLDKEREKLWAEVERLKEAVHKLSSSTSEDVQSVKQNLDSIVKLHVSSAASAKEIADLESNLSTSLHDLSTQSEELKTLSKQIRSMHTQSTGNDSAINEIYEKITELDTEFTEQLDDIKSKYAECQKYLADSAVLKTNLTNLEQNCTSYTAKIEALHKKSVEKHGEIEDYYDEVFGYDTEDNEHVDGLKEKLDGTYSELETAFSTLNEEFNNLKTEKFNEINADLKNKHQKYEEIQKKIESMLPGAMTTGLSFAYHEKRQSELEERKISDKIFYRSIIALTIIALIPFLLGCYLYFGKSIEIQEIILDTPRIFLAMLPLYAPALWVAYSSNRKSNLSKRLIEEYTHKETLSKTFEGLAKQIENLEDDEDSIKLKIKLLYNIVSMSSENPGVLIKGYNKSDHPFMDIIDKSTNLTNALEKLAHLPGIKGIANSLLERVETYQEAKVQKGITVTKTVKDEE